MSESPIRDAYLKALLNPEQEGDSPLYGGKPMCGECNGPRDEKRCCIR
jgi:hypothetical protein